MKKFLCIASAGLILTAFMGGYLHGQYDRYHDLQARYERGLKVKEQMAKDNERLRRELAEKKQAVVATKPDKIVLKNPTLAAKNNNPCNIKTEYGGKKWRGQISKDKFNHAVFENESYGIRAAAMTLRTYALTHKIDTLDVLVDRFCTAPKETKAKYVSFLEERLGVKPKEKINIIARMSDLLSAIAKFESGKEIDPKIIAHYDILGKL